MRKLILIISLISTICFSADWSRYYINNGNSPYMWIVCQTSMLTNTIPEGIKWSTVQIGVDENDEPVTRQKTLREYVYPHMTHDLPDGTTVFLVRAMARLATRPDPMTDEDADQWAYYFSQFGYTNFLTTAEARALLPEVTE